MDVLEVEVTGKVVTGTVLLDIGVRVVAPVANDCLLVLHCWHLDDLSEGCRLLANLLRALLPALLRLHNLFSKLCSFIIRHDLKNLNDEVDGKF